jgi:glycosyltransferase involved in cell wall biosynthesis
VRVAYLNHTGLVSGAEYTLLESLRRLPPTVSPLLVSPAGPLRDAASRAAIATAAIRGFDASLKLDPVGTPAALAALLSSAFSLRRTCRRAGIDLVHANSIRAGLIAGAARRLGGPPAAVMIWDSLPSGRVADLTRWEIQRRTDAVLACSRYTAECFGPGVSVVYPSVELQPAPNQELGLRFRADLGIAEDALLLGVVGQITPWKAQHTAIRALDLVRRSFPDVTLLIAGSAKFLGRRRYDNPAYLERLRSLTTDLSLDGSVRFLGERRDVSALMSALDLLLVPSAEEPFGRVVVEAMLAGTPPLATSVGGPAEVIDDGRTGFLIPPGDPRPWADRILELTDAPERRARIGSAAVTAARAFTPERHVRELIQTYERLRGGGDPTV